ncbi:MAG: hypothetical protein PQJ59_02740 [Spirochaetales bacterium]|nr:hypothetical protein [Spirochaetales bacterium]
MIFEQINGYIQSFFYYIFIALLIAYLFLSRKSQERKKALVFFFWGIIFFLVMIAAVLTVAYGLPSYLPTVFFVLLAGTSLTLYRERFFPFKFKCRKCGAKLKSNEIMLEKDYLCADCSNDEGSEE